MWLIIWGVLKDFDSFLLKYWKQVLILGFIGLFAYQMFSPVEFLFGLGTVPSEKAKYVAAEHNIAILQQQVKTIETANQGLSTSLTDQNDRIQGWGNLSKKIDDSTQQLIKEITKSQAQSKIDISSILNKPTPQTCEQSIDFLRSAITSGDISWKK